ncbi:hypothetical protein PTKIN_Ptkin02bG0239900 [Pterospermum kingtungense]
MNIICLKEEVRKVILKSSDGKLFEVDEAVALKSGTIKHLIEDVGGDEVIHLPGVSSWILEKVIQFCTVKEPSEGNNFDQATYFTWSDAFLGSFRSWTLIDMIVAADYLNIELLLHLACDYVARQIYGFSPAEIVQYFEYSLTQVEEEFLDILNSEKEDTPDYEGVVWEAFRFVLD